MGASGEQKTKPTQHSVAALRSIGIQPDALVLRSDRIVSEANKRKIALMCDVDERAVVNAIDVPSIYDIPTMLNQQGLDAYIIEQLGLSHAHEVNWDGWQQLLKTVHEPAHEVTIALVGKYVDLPDAYLSVTEALKAGGFAQETKVDIIDGGDLGGTMRLGLYEAELEPGSIVAELYGSSTASERHRHRYEVNNHYRGQLAEAGLVFSGVSPDRELVEYVELPRERHPFYVGTQAHPELRSRPNRPSPLFRGLVAAARERQDASRLFEVEEAGEDSSAA
jgi:CTP synthase (UTP-ammonia lyase)